MGLFRKHFLKKLAKHIGQLDDQDFLFRGWTWPKEEVEQLAKIETQVLVDLYSIHSELPNHRRYKKAIEILKELQKDLNNLLRKYPGRSLTVQEEKNIQQLVTDLKKFLYVPTGYDLEGKGRQVDKQRSYPPTMCVNEALTYRKETLKIMKEWRDKHRPFRPKEYSDEAVELKLEKFRWISDRLAEVYKIRKPLVRVGKITAKSWRGSGSSGTSYYTKHNHRITINGKFSVITFLHEFGHARGFDEVDTVMWSINIFRIIFPKSFKKLRGSGHMALG